MLNKSELLVEVLTNSLTRAKVGLIVKGFADLSPIDLLESLITKVDGKIYAVAVGYNCVDADTENFALTSKVENAVKWRSAPELSGKIIVFIESDSDKLHSLKELDIITARAVSEQLISDCTKQQTNVPLHNFWEALLDSLDYFSFDTLYEFAESVKNEELLEDGSPNTDAISNNMWRLGLLSDSKILGLKVKPSEQIAQNRDIIVRIGQMSDADRKRLSSALAKAKDNDLSRYQSAYRNLQTFFKYGKRETLKELDFSTILELLSAMKTPKKASGGGDGDGDTVEKVIREKELGEITARCVVISYNENKDYLDELLAKVRHHFDADDHPTEIGQLGGDEFDNRKIVLDKHDSALLTKVRRFCTEEIWGGIVETDETVLRDAVDSKDVLPINTFEPETVTSVMSYDDRTLFTMLRDFDVEFRKKGADSVDYFTDIVQDLVECRKTLLQNLELIMYFPILAFGADKELRNVLYKYNEKWAELLRAFNRNESLMREISHKSARSIARSLLLLDVLYIKTPTEWKGILMPLHPLFLWRYYEVFKSLSSSAEFSEQDAINLSKVFYDLPQVLNFLVVDNSITTDNVNVELPCSGTCEMLPTFENKTNRYLGDDGIECVEEILSRWIAFAPYASKEVRICTVDAPNNASILKSLKEFLKNNPESRVVYSVFLTRGQNGNADMAKLEYDSNDYEIGEYIRQGRLCISIRNFPSKTALADIKEELTERPVHIAYYFDQSSYSIEHGPTTQQLYINPLVVTYDYDYDTMTHRGEIFPSTDMESGIIGDYHKLMRIADLTSLNRTPRPTYKSDADIKALLTTVDDRQTVWLVGADRTISNYLPKKTIPIGEKRYKQRAVGIWASDGSRVIEQYMRLLRKYNLHPQRETLLKILTNFGHISSDGLISIPRSGSDSVAIENRRKGLIGTVITAKYYSKVYPASLVASLDTHDARLWLRDNKLVDGDERADLIGLRYDENGNTIYIEPIEVKTRDDSPDAKIGQSESGERIITGHAADQIASVIRMIRQMFGNIHSNMFVSARKEVFKFQIVSECFRSIHDDEQGHQWQQDWDARFKKLFGKTPTDDLNIVVRGKLIHVKLGEPTDQPSVTCKHGEYTDCEIDVITLTTKEIQEFISESDAPTGGVDWDNPDFDNTGDNDDNDEDFETNYFAPTDEFTVGDATSFEQETTEGKLTETKKAEEDVKVAPVAPKVSAAPVAVVTDEEKAQLANDFKKSCHGYGIQIDECDPNKAIVGSSVIRFPFKLGRKQKWSKLEGALEDIGREMRKTGILVQTAVNADTFLDVPRLNRDRVLFSDIIDSIPQSISPEQLFFPIGRMPDGDDKFQDLKECPHLLVGGSTGAGKSVFLYTLLCAILKTHPKADDCKILLASSKGEDFVFFEALPQLVDGRVITDAAEMIKMFRTNVFEETMRRSEILKSAKKRDLTSYNATAGEKLAPFVVVVDEFADLTDQLTTSADKNAFYTLFKTIAQAGRSRGVHLVLCTQRPSADVVPTNITANLNARLALRVNNAIASRMIIDDKGAESLMKHGDMLYKMDSGSERIRAQGYYIDTEEVDEIVNAVKQFNGIEL
jgi:hypothetical protein